MPSADYPILFHRKLFPKVWGARNLEKYLNIQIEGGVAIGESWELSDHKEWNSVVVNGPLAGKTLGEIVKNDPNGVVGRAPLARGGRFPLLIKFIDTSDHLSVQVHPDDAAAERLQAADGGKNEAWFFVSSDPEAKIWAGLAPGKKYNDLENAKKNAGEPRDVVAMLTEMRPRSGDAIAIEAGTVHAIGAGVTVCEVQQTSDITYRVYDWGRPETPARKLHPEESRACAKEYLHPKLVNSADRGELPSPGFFRWNLHDSAERFTTKTGGSFRAVICIEGSGLITSEKSSITPELKRGAVALIPAAAEKFTIQPNGPMRWILVEPAAAGAR